MSAANDLRIIPDELRLDAQNPWPGLTAFTEKQHDFFYGRSQESHELFACVKRERLTVLFGKSGLGKTSLLQAGLFPQLRDANYLPVYVRLNYEDAAAPFDTQLGMALGAAIESANFAEVALPAEGESVWEYLHRRGGNLINDEGNVVMPVLIFDQFEECFTLGARKDFSSRLVNEFLPGLGDMIENRIPASLTKKLTEDRDLAKRYDLEAHGCRILITLREDYLANLEALRDSMPSLVYIDNRMRLTEMTGEQALSVVIDPSPNLVDADVAESIVRFVAGAHTDSADGDVRTVDALPLKSLEVAPAILSLFCSQLNEERLKTPGMSKITRALVLSQGVTIIEDFYKKCIAGMHPAVRRLIEDRLLTTAGYRDNIDLAEARATLQRAGADPSYIDELVKLRLLQIEDHRGVPRLELTHDVLAEPVKHSRDDWKKEQQHEAAQQQERDALLRAKEAAEEALHRTRFLQRMVAAAAFVCLLLAGVVVYGWVERNQAKSNAARAEKNQERAQQNQERAEQNQNRAEQNQKLAIANEQQAVQMKLQAQDEAAIANSNQTKAQESAKKAEQSALEAEANAKDARNSRTQLTGMSSDILNHCVTIYNDFDDTSKKEQDDAGKDSVRVLYEHLLLGSGQCLELAEEAHRVEPNDMDVTDSLTMIPVRAAASAASRKINPQAIREQVLRDFETEQQLPVFQNETKDDVTEIEIARAWLAFAFILNSIHDDSAQSIAQKGANILTRLPSHAKPDTWDYHQWDILADAHNWHAIYLQGQDQNAEAIAALVEATKDEKKAYEIAPKEKIYYANQFLYLSLRLANTERDLGAKDETAIQSYKDELTQAKQQNNKAKIAQLSEHSADLATAEQDLAARDDAALQSYQQALAIAKQKDDKPSITDIYTNMRVVLVRSKKYDEAIALLAPRIQALLATPPDTQRNKDLAQAYRDCAETEEAKPDWPQDITYRAHVVEVLASMKPESYTDQPSDLVYAYSLLSWAEIYDKQIDKGIADTRRAITLSQKSEGHPGAYASFTNGINALTFNKKYDEAQKLVDEFEQTLISSPPSIERDREIATVADPDEVRIATATGDVRGAAKYRLDAATRLAALKPDAYTDLKADLVSAYGNLSFEQEQAGNFAAGVEAAKAGFALDPSQFWIEENEANGLLLSGHTDEAKVLYQKIKDIQWQGAPLSAAVGDDFLTFCKLGYARPEMNSIAHDLNITSPDLFSCLAAPPKKP